MAFYHSNLKKENVIIFSMECSVCGISGERVKLFDVVSIKGIVKLCGVCNSESNSPKIKSFGSKFGSEDTWKEPNVSEVLSRISGIEIKEKKEPENPRVKEQEEELRRIANSNIQKAIQEKPVSTEDLVDKFHWIIMRVRRSKKITQTELAKEIGESEAAVKMAEQGIISARTPLLIEKIESYFGIKLRKRYEPETKEYISPGNLKYENEEKKPSLGFDPITSKNITIADLRHLRKEKEMSLFQKPEQELEEPEEPEKFKQEVAKEVVEEKEQEWVKEDKKMEKDLSDGEIDDLIFGRG